MMDNRLLDQLRRSATDLENATIDEFLAGYIGRRALLCHGSVLGMSAPLIAALGFPTQVTRAATGQSRPVRVGMTVPAGAINPLTIGDTGGICMMSQVGEYLAVSDPNLTLRPVLAESWKPNDDGSVWTFKIRKGVQFHNSQTLTAADVAGTIDRLTDPANGSVALSAFSGALSKGGARAIDDETVEFHLDAPNGNFPYLVSSDNYNTIILPANYAGDFDKTFIGTGPFKLEKFIPRARASFVRNDDYWGPRAAIPNRTTFIFYDSIQAQVLAMQGRQLDALLHVPVQGSQALLVDPHLNIVTLKSSAHEQFHMRTDLPPFNDKRVRRAVALCLNRENIATGMFRSLAVPGNDSPFAPLYASTDPTVPQRQQDINSGEGIAGRRRPAQWLRRHIDD
jgi:peptide/nickel transport system substrate-binding protein